MTKEEIYSRLSGIQDQYFPHGYSTSGLADLLYELQIRPPDVEMPPNYQQVEPENTPHEFKPMTSDRGPYGQVCGVCGRPLSAFVHAPPKPTRTRGQEIAEKHAYNAPQRAREELSADIDAAIAVVIRNRDNRNP